MTDYASQGKTCPNNVVDLTNCTSHQSYYTALLRSATAEGTMIVQSFLPRPITGRASGWLRQEFHELELLDNITMLAYRSILPKEINGLTRGIRIKQYQDWKGHDYVPKNVHRSIVWSSNSLFIQASMEEESDWKLIEREKNEKKVNSAKSTDGGVKVPRAHLQAALGSIPIKGVKQKVTDEEHPNVGNAKKLKPNSAEG